MIDLKIFKNHEIFREMPQVELKVEEKPREKARRKSHSKGKVVIANYDTKSLNSDDASNLESESATEGDHDNNKDIDQMASLLVKSFKRMVYKDFKKGKRFSRKGSSSSKSDRRNYRKNSDEKEAKSEKYDKSKEKCQNCDGVGHLTADYRKPRAEKRQALITKKKNWDDTSESDCGVNYALTENADIEADTDELKVPDQTLENARIKTENFDLKNRNDHLKGEFIFMLETQKERDDALYVK
ncbi:hypothetical protein AgCh_017285 [Apium graveolens]